jgi:predicted outer membrane repeat protein
MAILTVTSKANSGAGSLRETISKAQAGDTIKFASSLANQSITLSSNLKIDKNLTVDAANASNLTISGNKATPVFWVDKKGTNFTVRNLTVADGFLPKDYGGAIHTTDQVTLRVENCKFNNNVARAGGAIFIRDRSNLTVINSKFNGNDAAKYGDQEMSAGAIGTLGKCNVTIKGSEFKNNKGINGGAVYTIFSNLTIENSTFIKNDSTPGKALGSPTSSAGTYTRGYGGAVYTDGASVPDDAPYRHPGLPPADGAGKIIIRNSRFEENRAAGLGGAMDLFTYPEDKTTIENCTIINNEVIKDNRPEAKGGGVYAGLGELTINNTTFANNKAHEQGGGLYVDGPKPIKITNSTFSGNKAQDSSNKGKGGGIAIQHWTWDTDAKIINTTFANNYAASEAGAIQAGNINVRLTNSIFYKNTAGNSQKIKQQTNKQLTDAGNNLQYPHKLTNNSSDVNVTAKITIADPKLGPLQDNGGSTLTHALLKGSPAINKGTSTGAPTTDERGYKRDSQPDIGAYEYGAKSLSKTSVVGALSLRSNEPSLAATQQQQVANEPPSPSTGQQGEQQQVANESPSPSTGQQGEQQQVANEPPSPSTGQQGEQQQVANEPAPAAIEQQGEQQQVANEPAPAAIEQQEKGEFLDLRDFTGQVQAEFVVNRDAAYANSFGFYAVDDATGRIDNLNPGDSGYAEAAIRERVDLSTGYLPGGNLFAPFLVADATPEEFLAKNPDNQAGKGPFAYFAFLGANPDGTDHVNLSGDKTFGFEDAFGGGDLDHNDLVVQVKLT